MMDTNNDGKISTSEHAAATKMFTAMIRQGRHGHRAEWILFVRDLEGQGRQDGQ